MLLIDYEGTAFGPRGYDLAIIMIMQMLLFEGGVIKMVAGFPDDMWRRTFITNYLNQYKSLAPNDWDEQLDNLDHVMMECDLNVLHYIHFLLAMLMSQGKDSYFHQNRKFSKSWVVSYCQR